MASDPARSQDGSSDEEHERLRVEAETSFDDLVVVTVDYNSLRHTLGVLLTGYGSVRKRLKVVEAQLRRRTHGARTQARAKRASEPAAVPHQDAREGGSPAQQPQTGGDLGDRQVAPDNEDFAERLACIEAELDDASHAREADRAALEALQRELRESHAAPPQGESKPSAVLQSPASRRKSAPAKDPPPGGDPAKKRPSAAAAAAVQVRRPSVGALQPTGRLRTRSVDNGAAAGGASGVKPRRASVTRGAGSISPSSSFSLNNAASGGGAPSGGLAESLVEALEKRVAGLESSVVHLHTLNAAPLSLLDDTPPQSPCGGPPDLAEPDADEDQEARLRALPKKVDDLRAITHRIAKQLAALAASHSGALRAIADAGDPALGDSTAAGPSARGGGFAVMIQPFVAELQALRAEVARHQNHATGSHGVPDPPTGGGPRRSTHPGLGCEDDAGGGSALGPGMLAGDRSEDTARVNQLAAAVEDLKAAVRALSPRAAGSAGADSVAAAFRDEVAGVKAWVAAALAGGGGQREVARPRGDGGAHDDTPSGPPEASGVPGLRGSSGGRGAGSLAGSEEPGVGGGPRGENAGGAVSADRFAEVCGRVDELARELGAVKAGMQAQTRGGQHEAPSPGPPEASSPGGVPGFRGSAGGRGAGSLAGSEEPGAGGQNEGPDAEGGAVSADRFAEVCGRVDVLVWELGAVKAGLRAQTQHEAPSSGPLEASPPGGVPGFRGSSGGRGAGSLAGSDVSGGPRGENEGGAVWTDRFAEVCGRVDALARELGAVKAGLQAQTRGGTPGPTLAVDTPAVPAETRSLAPPDVVMGPCGGSAGLYATNPAAQRGMHGHATAEERPSSPDAASGKARRASRPWENDVAALRAELLALNDKFDSLHAASRRPTPPTAAAPENGGSAGPQAPQAPQTRAFDALRQQFEALQKKVDAAVRGGAAAPGESPGVAAGGARRRSSSLSKASAGGNRGVRPAPRSVRSAGAQVDPGSADGGRAADEARGNGNARGGGGGGGGCGHPDGSRSGAESGGRGLNSGNAEGGLSGLRPGCGGRDDDGEESGPPSDNRNGAAARGGRGGVGSDLGGQGSNACSGPASGNTGSGGLLDTRPDDGGEGGPNDSVSSERGGVGSSLGGQGSGSAARNTGRGGSLGTRPDDGGEVGPNHSRTGAGGSGSSVGGQGGGPAAGRTGSGLPCGEGDGERPANDGQPRERYVADPSLAGLRGELAALKAKIDAMAKPPLPAPAAKPQPPPPGVRQPSDAALIPLPPPDAYNDCDDLFRSPDINNLTARLDYLHGTVETLSSQVKRLQAQGQILPSRKEGGSAHPGPAEKPAGPAEDGGGVEKTLTRFNRDLGFLREKEKVLAGTVAKLAHAVERGVPSALDALRQQLLAELAAAAAQPAAAAADPQLPPAPRAHSGSLGRGGADDARWADVDGRLSELSVHKADSVLVAGKADLAYVDASVQKSRKDVVQATNAAYRSLTETVDRNLRILRDMLEQRAPLADFLYIKQLVSELAGVPENPSGLDGLIGTKGIKCLSCKRSLEMRPRSTGMNFVNFMSHLPQNAASRCGKPRVLPTMNYGTQFPKLFAKSAAQDKPSPSNIVSTPPINAEQPS
ncbi:hypothetical protein DIPPA_33175 [Diplonema papillatum]|nr:hypothetical protein DIPPA_33175 [Diplonema papillatum]